MTGGSFVANEKTVMIKEGCPLTYRNCQSHIPAKGALHGTDLYPMRRLSHSRSCVIGHKRVPYREIWPDAPCLLKRPPAHSVYRSHCHRKAVPHLEKIDTACRERLEIVEKAMMQQEGVMEALKAADQMAWVCSMNSIRSRAENIVLTEIIYC